MKSLLGTLFCLLFATAAVAQEPPSAPTPDEAANGAPKIMPIPKQPRRISADAKVTLTMGELQALIDEQTAPTKAKLASCIAEPALRHLQEQLNADEKAPAEKP